MKFPTSGSIFKSDMSADKTAFHRPAITPNQTKKKLANLEDFQELVAEKSPIKNYLLS